MMLNDFNMGRRKTKFFVCALILVCIYNFLGISDYIHAKSFDDDFDYPLNIDLRPVVRDTVWGKIPKVPAINHYSYNFLTSWQCGSVDRMDLVILVKSAMDHFGHRAAIRQTYGQENLIPGRIVKTLFFVGMHEQFLSGVQEEIAAEMKAHKDIIQMDFVDSYFNNTIKTMMSFRWAYERCHAADFYLFTDDDMYISVTNLLDYVHDQMEATGKNGSKPSKNDELFAGYVFKSTPQRFKSSKWWVSLDEYPWDRWPPYITAGAYVVSNKSMRYLYIGCLFVKHFRFDDIYLGIIAKKVGLELTHCPAFYYYKKKYSKEGYRDVVASHGYSDHEELIQVWNEQNSISHS